MKPHRRINQRENGKRPLAPKRRYILAFDPASGPSYTAYWPLPQPPTYRINLAQYGSFLTLDNGKTWTKA